MSNEVQRQTLPVAADCWYYRQGDTRSEPLAAKVTRSNSSGILDLNVYPPNHGHHDVRRAIRHVDDPWFQSPHGEKQKIQDGAWDYVEHRKPSGDEHLSPEATEARVKELYARFKDASLVAAAMQATTGVEWTDTRVLAIARPKKHAE